MAGVKAARIPLRRVTAPYNTVFTTPYMADDSP